MASYQDKIFLCLCCLDKSLQFQFCPRIKFQSSNKIFFCILILHTPFYKSIFIHELHYEQESLMNTRDQDSKLE